MGDLFELLIFFGVVLLSLLASGKKKKKKPTATKKRPSAPAGAAQQQQRSRASRPAKPKTARATPRQASSRQAGVEDLLDILRGRLPMPEPVASETPELVLEEVDDEAQSLEDVNFDRTKAHRSFHDRYIEEPTPITAPQRETRHKYRLTPRTAREAVVWTAIFTRPKGLE